MVFENKFIFSDILSGRRRGVGDGRRKIRLDSKIMKFRFFEKQIIDSEKTVTKSMHDHRGINCSFCYHNLEEAMKFRFNQLRSFGRQSKRLDSKTLTIGNV